MNKHKKGCRKDSLFCLRRSTATAAKDDDCDKDDDPAIIVAEERIKAAHNIASLHYIVHIMFWEGKLLIGVLSISGKTENRFFIFAL